MAHPCAGVLIDKLAPTIECLNTPGTRAGMNIHHLELFFYVARHGGVSAAARRIPYGIQQPAISAQIIQLEDHLGTTLFMRRPFQLTPSGETLYRYIEPFFAGLAGLEQSLRGGAPAELRIGTIETVQREYLPAVLRALRQRVPEAQFKLMPMRLDEIEACLLAQKIDIGIAWLLEKRPAGIHQCTLVEVPMSLLVPDHSPLTTAETLWQQDRISQPLITGHTESSIYRLFQSVLQQRKVEWFTSIQLNSQELICRYVAEGFGMGLILAEPGRPAPPGTRVLPLPDFPPVPYGLLWIGTPTPLQRLFFELAQAAADTLQVNAPASGPRGRSGKRTPRRKQS